MPPDKKAVAYYIGQGLIHPAVLGNGYRDFSNEDVARLNKIAVLRGLNLSVPDIRAALDDARALSNIVERKKLELERSHMEGDLLGALARGQGWDQTCAALDQLDKKQSILKRLLNKFPGAFGRYIAWHFAPYLDAPIETAAQLDAFDTIVGFLDKIDFSLPEDLQALLEDALGGFDADAAKRMNDALASAARDPQRYLAENSEAISRYAAFKESVEYRQSAACRLTEHMKKLNSENGYDEVFIPAMCRLSASYRAYHDLLIKANDVF